MRTEQRVWNTQAGWSGAVGNVDPSGASLVWLFGAPSVMTEERVADIGRQFPAATLFGCSTAGEVHGTTVSDDSLAMTAIEFEDTTVRQTSLAIGDYADGVQLGRALAATLEPKDLRHVIVLSDGLGVNGSALARGLTGGLPANIAVTGGLAADGARFERTLVVADGAPRSGYVSAVGLYGARLRVGYASLGGWDSFGPERLVTRSAGNVLSELDGRSALELYKRYLGDQADGLPATGLLFPLALRVGDQPPVVRTILAINEDDGSITFAGDVPEGAFVRLMKANFDRLIDGAIGAARGTGAVQADVPPEFALLISCIGRKLVLRQRTEEEVEGVRDVFGDRTVLTGFYSYGEISPFTTGGTCELHNQTMTITTLAEAAAA